MARPVVQLLILLLAIPAQYLITLWGSTNTDATSIKVRKLVTTLQEFCKKWVLPKTWLDELKQLWFYLTDKRGQCVAVEVMKYRSDVGYFGNSPEPRHERPAKVKYRIGQVFLHKSAGYHGVIIGWDDHARAPDMWLEDQYGSKATEKGLEPHYAVLPDQSEHGEWQTYISQDEIEIVSNRKDSISINTTKVDPQSDSLHNGLVKSKASKIENDVVYDYFEAFNGVAYEPRVFMKQLYPKD